MGWNKKADAENKIPSEKVENLYNLIIPQKKPELAFPKGDPLPKVVIAVKTPYKQYESVREDSTMSLSEWLLKLRTCEAGGIYTRNTGNGYYGAYQFSQATWSHWNKDYATANLAPPEVQDAMIILNTNNTAGLVSQNPGCYRKTGLSNKPPRI